MWSKQHPGSLSSLSLSLALPSFTPSQGHIWGQCSEEMQARFRALASDALKPLALPTSVCKTQMTPTPTSHLVCNHESREIVQEKDLSQNLRLDEKKQGLTDNLWATSKLYPTKEAVHIRNS